MAPSNHEMLVANAEAAIEEVFSDTSVSREQTKASLRDLREGIESRIVSIITETD